MSVPKHVELTDSTQVHNSVLTGDNEEDSYEILKRYTTGENDFSHKAPKYVCHTSTIPLATVVDFEWLVGDQNDYICKTSSEFHGYKDISAMNTDDSDGDSVCSLRSCMYVGAYDKKRKTAHLYENCACRKPELLNSIPGKRKGKPLKPFCFIKFLRNQGEALKRTARDDRPLEIDPEEVMFCPDARSILDAKYSGPMSDHANSIRKGISCINDCRKADELVGLMRMLYWFREFWKKLDLVTQIRKSCEEHGIAFVIKAMKQALHTINGLLVKKMLVFPGEISKYNSLTRQTAIIFKDLFEEYCDTENQMPESLKVYKETKELFQACKATFFAEFSPEIRRSFLDFEFKSASLKAFFSTEFKELGKELSKAIVNRCDYTLSMAWRYRCGLFCQTRILGYLPEFIAKEAMERFRIGISRKREYVSKKKKEFIHRVTLLGVCREIGRNCMHKETVINDLYSSIEMDIKLSASKDHTLREGGRLEDARSLVRKAIDNKWVIAKRDLGDFSERETFVCDDLTDNLAEPIFWISIQIGINFLISKNLLDEKYRRDFWHDDPKGAKLRVKYELNPLECEVVHINETGKLRNLVKSRSIFAWILSPGSKISQELLSRLKEHEAGLKAGAQGWAHTRRIGGETTESDFMYDTRGSIKRVFHGFKDWKEATDFLLKDIGLASLDAFLTYVGFPKMYKRMILLLLNLPQPVLEAHYVSILTDGERNMERLQDYEAQINDGFMMGNQFTKTILHLVHVVELETAKIKMKKMRLMVNETPKGEFKSTRNITVPPEAEDRKPVG